MPNIPITVWEQIQVVIVFAFLLSGLAWLMVRAFSKAISDINQHYAAIIEKSNVQWQQYFDARSDSNKVINDQMLDKLARLTDIIEKLVMDFERHDALEMSVIKNMGRKHK